MPMWLGIVGLWILDPLVHILGFMIWRKKIKAHNPRKSKVKSNVGRISWRLKGMWGWKKQSWRERRRGVESELKSISLFPEIRTLGRANIVLAHLIHRLLLLHLLKENEDQLRNLKQMFGTFCQIRAPFCQRVFSFLKCEAHRDGMCLRQQWLEELLLCIMGENCLSSKQNS